MKTVFFLITGMTLIAVLLGAGCVSPVPGNSVSNQTIPVLTTIPQLATLELEPSDLPAGYALESGRQKSITEVSSMARDLGWEEGYVANYTSPQNNPGNLTVITQTITVYPEAKMPEIVNVVNLNERQVKGLDFTDLPSPDTGSETYAFSATVNKTDDGAAAVAPLTTSSGTLQPLGYVEVIFAKGNILEVIRISGPRADNETLRSVAKSAFAKIA